MSSSTEQVGVQSNSFVENFFLEAKKLNDAKWVYGLYGAMDGLSTSFSMLKYFFDMYYTNSRSTSSDVLRNWSITPAGIAFMTIESIALIGCAIIGNTMDDDGYYLHFMSVSKARQSKHVNCFIWDDINLIYISADGSETVFSRPGDMVNVGLIKKIKTNTIKNPSSSHLSIKQAQALLIEKESAFLMSAPTPTLTGTIASHWPYARDVMKAMKNTYKGIRNSFVLTDLLVVGREYHYLAVPVGLGLGILAACNRTWLRKIRDERKDAKKLNIELTKSLLEAMSIKNAALTLSDWDLLHNQMTKEHAKIHGEIRPSSHSQWFWLYAQLSAALSGMIDSPYLYFGALSLAVALPTSWFFIYVAAASFLFAATCIVTRVYEEHNFQRELLASQLDVELAMSIQKVRLLRDNLLAINNDLSVTTISTQNKLELESKQAELVIALQASWRECQSIQREFVNQSTFSWVFIFMSGLKNGLDTYNAMASLMFLIATISLVVLVPYSQLLVMLFVTTGLAGLLLFPALALMGHYFSPDRKIADSASPLEEKKSTLEFFSDIERDMEGKSSSDVTLSTPVFYDGLLEIFRGACSGGGKGIRGVEQVMAVAQELGADGHYHDTDSILIFGLIDAVLFAITFGLRGFARLGRGVTVTAKPEKNKSIDENLPNSAISQSLDSGDDDSAETKSDNDDHTDYTDVNSDVRLGLGSGLQSSPVTVAGSLSQENIARLVFFKPQQAQSRENALDQVFEADIALD